MTNARTERWWRNIERRRANSIAFLLILAILFTGLAFLIRQPAVVDLDLDFTRSVQRLSGPWMDRVGLAFTALGSAAVLAPLAIVATVLCRFRGRKLTGWLCLASAGGLILNVVLKDVIDRPRPSADLVRVVAPVTGTSYPSGHVMGAVSVYGFLGYLVWTLAPQGATRVVGTIGFVATILMVSLSRIYLGAHWLSDVLGGWTAGLGWLLILAEIQSARGHSKAHDRADRAARTLSHSRGP